MTAIDDPPEVIAGDGDEPEMVAKLKHPRAIRWMHWINFPVLLIMVWSGMRIYWANDVFSISLGSWTPFRFWPQSWNEWLQLDGKLAKGIAYHLNFGWFFVLNGLAYVSYLVFSTEWRHIVPDRQGFKDVGRTILHDLYLRKEAPPQGRYNSAQQLSYTAVIAMAALLVLSGFAIYKPVQLGFLTFMMGGYKTARIIHFVMTIGIMLFFVLHIVQVLRAGWKNFASMITGYEVEPLNPTNPSAQTALVGANEAKPHSNIEPHAKRQDDAS